MRIEMSALALCLLLTTSAFAQETIWKVVAPPVLKEGWEAIRINTATGQCCQPGDGAERESGGHTTFEDRSPN